MSFGVCDVNEFQLAGDIRFDCKLFTFFESEIRIAWGEKIAEDAIGCRVVCFFVVNQDDRVAGFSVLNREFGYIKSNISLCGLL